MKFYDTHNREKAELVGSILFYSVISLGLFSLPFLTLDKNVTYSNVNDDTMQFTSYLILIYGCFVGLSLYHLIMALIKYRKLEWCECGI